jgi:hypothetical protein
LVTRLLWIRNETVAPLRLELLLLLRNRAGRHAILAHRDRRRPAAVHEADPVAKNCSRDLQPTRKVRERFLTRMGRNGGSPEVMYCSADGPAGRES